MRTLPISILTERIHAFCVQWGVKEFALFGSVLGEHFTAESDIDVLLELRPEASLSMFDWIAMKDELTAILGREVDLVSKEGLRNPFRKQSILGSREIIYAA